MSAKYCTLIVNSSSGSIFKIISALWSLLLVHECSALSSFHSVPRLSCRLLEADSVYSFRCVWNELRFLILFGKCSLIHFIFTSNGSFMKHTHKHRMHCFGWICSYVCTLFCLPFSLFYPMPKSSFAMHMILWPKL